jgi:hypothetical protein
LNSSAAASSAALLLLMSVSAEELVATSPAGRVAWPQPKLPPWTTAACPQLQAQDLNHHQPHDVMDG